MLIVRSSELFNIYMNHIFSVTEKHTNSCVSSVIKLSTWFQVLKLLINKSLNIVKNHANTLKE